ncbi:fumarylacetoacetate hydrolase family protein [Defluviimonas salinarum]|uniref:Fumarylacetoacetate hydrolase family protein n=1 Tax=Defluviimonas salinarum TaxID=2992147 RepID=A0ABT3J1S2_9RHOB|nr:fumarylacetoacetate hydrolase family protein [Defluviimonas salinarum]MCW3781618.1 fumarylacetoacetate hydrolase family protein [Defluviimonas salinarum]
MTRLVFPASDPVTVPLHGEDAAFPVTRIFCVGRNYADHAKEMGAEVDREAPFYFTKAPAHLTLSGATIPYPPGTADFHHEMEFVVALGAPAFRIPQEKALDAIFGYAAGLDMTRRDLQAAAKDKRRPWDTGKDFENAAVIGPITRAAAFGEPGPQGISLLLNGTPVQRARLADMVWSVAGIVAHLSTLYHMRAGDLIFTGTPAGVGPVRPGDILHGEIDGLAPVDLEIAPAD